MEEEKTKSTLKETFYNLKMTWKFFKGSRRYIFLFILIYALICALSVITPIYSAKQLLYISNGKLPELLKVSIFLLMLGVFETIFIYLQYVIINLYYKKVIINIQTTLSKEILKLEIEEIDNNSSGVFIERLSRDSEGLCNIFQNLIETFGEIISNVGILAVIFMINKKIFVFFIIIMTLLVILEYIRVKKFNKKVKVLRKAYERNTGFITEMIRGLRDIKVLGSENVFLNLEAKELSEIREKEYKIYISNNFISRLFEIIKAVIKFSLIFFCIKLVSNEELTIENFLIIFTYAPRASTLLSNITYGFNFFGKFNLSCSRIFEILDGTKFKKEKFGNINKSKLKGNFEFKHVKFKYENNKNYVFEDLNFKVNANETVAFVGKSGVGKTTILNLLTKIYHPNEGEILIDGININDLTKDSIRKNISIITQNPYIFNLSIKENLKLVKSNVTKAEMVDACKKACLHDFIMTLPKGYDTVVGEGGVTLSGGQRQRLAIARAFIKNAEIILFDEATSALDNETQDNIQDAIKNLQKSKTILIVAHRLSTVINCDKIMVLDKGNIVDVGTHFELLKKSKTYQKLYKTELKK